MIRRGFIGTALAGSVAGALARCGHGSADTEIAMDPEWTSFKARFVTEDGRVRDTGNGDISHSEGQGYGMLLAEAAGDRDGFGALWAWTQEHLDSGKNGLFVWKWDPRQGGGGGPDRNNASDGDLLIAWALARSARRWRDHEHRRIAASTARAVRQHCIMRTSNGPVLLPGADGFVHDGVATTNLSYWVFPALVELAALDSDPIWTELISTGLDLLEVARFGRFELPPDWLAMTSPLRPSALFPPVFGYNAVRIPLYLQWAGLGSSSLLAPFEAFWQGFPAPPPAVFDLVRDQPEGDRASAGIQAVAALAAWREGQPVPELPPLERAGDYYAGALLLLTKLAWREMPA